MSVIHPTAIVHPRAQIAASVEIGPYCVIDEHVSIDADTVLAPHVRITGHTQLGKHNRIGSFSVLGGMPQDKKYAGEPTRLQIGDHNTIFEYVTMSTGTAQDQGLTQLGSHNWIMAYVHIAHDCVLADHCIMSNNAQLAGHVQMGDYAILGGMAGVHQFCRIGAHAMIGAKSLIVQDVAPFITVSGMPAKAFGLNAEGLTRRGFSAESIKKLKQAFKHIYQSGALLKEAIASLESDPAWMADAHCQALLAFIKAPGRGLLR
ncbi:MAG: acyl-ACP--UDP-N-acetylglucosamine O-acyltransferase [Pseudomonadota bacterium]|jgi:UDP-N-acetylglucosamine acyltransferase